MFHYQLHFNQIEQNIGHIKVNTHKRCYINSDFFCNYLFLTMLILSNTYYSNVFTIW